MAENHSGFTLSCCTQGFLLSHFRCRSFSRGRPPVSGCSTQSKGRSHFSFRVRYGGCGRTPQFSAGRCARISVSAVFEECFAQAQALIQAYSPHMQTRKEENSSCKMTVAGRLRISPESRQAFLGEKEIMLTRKEFDLLLLFAENPNKVFTCDQLYDLLWSEQTAYNVDEVVKAHIKSLRQKLSDDDSVQIKNVWGVGYRFCYNRK